MKEKIMKIMDSKKFTGFLLIVLFMIAALVTAISFGSGTKKNKILTNSLERMAQDLGCPKNMECDGPEHNKNRLDNGNGTYKIVLDVKGDATTSLPKKANVVIIMDTSNSMKNNNVGSTRTAYTYNESTYSIDYKYYSARTGGTQVERDGNKWVYASGTNAGREFTGQVYFQPNRISEERNALATLVPQLLANNVPSDNYKKDLVEISVVGYSLRSRPIISKSKDATEIENAIFNAHTSEGTNWEEGLQEGLAEAATLKENEPNDAIYIIFLTDGEPTARQGSEYYTTPSGSGNHGEADAYWKHWSAASDDAKAAANINGNADGLYTIFTYGTNNTYLNYLDNLTHFAYETKDGDTIRTYTNQNFGTEYTRNTRFFDAADTSALVTAFNSIAEDIKTSGIGSIEINDGTTTDVATAQGVSHLLEVDTTSYEYWLSMPVSTDNKITRVDPTSGDEYTIILEDNGNGTITANSTKWGTSGAVTVTGTIEDGIFKYKWTESNNLYRYNPPAASFANSSVKWDLKTLGTLLNDVTYTVTFDVYPSQETYDLIANFKNGTISYGAHYSQAEYNNLREDLQKYYSPVKDDDGNILYYELDANIRKYLSEDYKLETNTAATLTYSDTRPDENGNTISNRTVYFHDLDGTPLVSSQIEVEKIWANALDGRNATEPVLDEEGNPVYNDDGTPKTKPLVLDMYLMKDGKKSSEKITVTYVEKDGEEDPETSWKDKTYISTGLLKTLSKVKDDNGNVIGGTIQVLDSGHDYTLEEPSTISYHWELTMETVHPMLIDSATNVTTLVEVTGSDIPSEINSADENTFNVVGGETYYKFTYNGKVRVYIVKSIEETAELKAYNNRKSYVEFKKVVTGDAPAGKEFNFTFQVNNVIGANEEDDDVWFSVWDSKTNKQVIELNGLSNNVTAEVDEDGNPTGSYSAPNKSTITVLLEDGWNLRILNLGTGSTYSISETGVTICANETCTLDELKASSPQYFDLKDISVSATSGKDAEGNAIAIAYNLCEDGEANDYCIEENNVSGTVIQPDTAYSITYTNEYPGTYLTVNKNWLTLSDITNKEIQVQLYQQIEGEDDVTPVEGKIGTLKYVVGEDGKEDKELSWTYTFEGLPLVTDEKTPRNIIYSVKEVDVEDYKVSLEQIDKHTWTLTNTELTEIEVTKNWEDANNQDGLRDENTKVIFELYADGEKTDKTVELSGNPTANTYTDKFTDLPKYKLVDGEIKEIVYTVKEKEVPTGYTATAVCSEETTDETGATTTTDCSNLGIGTKDNSYTITNTHEPEVIEVNVVKSWNDNDNQDGIRPTSVEVTLYQSINGSTPTVVTKDGKAVT